MPEQALWPRRSVRAGPISFHVADDQRTFWERFARGDWEPATLAAIDRLIGPGTAFVDLGAWVGPTALYAAALGGRVLAVEPDPVAFDQLRRNLAANPALAGRVEALFAAAAPVAGPVRLGARREAGDSMSSVHLAGRGTEDWLAPAITPAELAARLGRPRRLVVKMDVEGAEYALLPALGPLLGAPRCALLLSLHPEHLDEADAVARTRTALGCLAGWRAFALRGGLIPWGGLDPWSPDADLATGTPYRDWLFLKPGTDLGPARDGPDKTMGASDPAIQAASLQSRGARK